MRRLLKTALVVVTLAAVVPVITAVTWHAPSAYALSVPNEPHPEIKAALGALARAKSHLQKAAHDFGGHRVDAIAAIDKAEEQLKLALQFDK
ncbi:MAG TPA: hypothetical protein VEI47_00825 [Gemmatimonadales bacterium]|nr:hypothetical protein [Gemmatimonadales bacterium]